MMKHIKKSQRPRFAASPAIQEIKTELVRKSIHFLIAFTPAIAAFSRELALSALSSGILFYICLESLRVSGIDVPFFSAISRSASRPRDAKRFVLGPVTLGAGALFALLLLPEAPAAIAIYALAAGDGLASLVGRSFGRVRPSVLMGKSLEGSLACFCASLLAAWHVCRDLPAALAAALAATAAEALPLEDYDNIAIPLAAGFTAKLFLGL